MDLFDALLALGDLGLLVVEDRVDVVSQEVGRQSNRLGRRITDTCQVIGESLSVLLHLQIGQATGICIQVGILEDCLGCYQFLKIADLN